MTERKDTGQATAEKTEAPVEDRSPKDAGGAEKPSRAGGFAQGETESRKTMGSGLSGDKGVAEVGDPAMPTGTSSGVEIGQPDKHGVMEGREDRTLKGQLEDKGLAEDEES